MKNIFIKILPFFLIFTMVMPLGIPFKAHATSMVYQYPISWSIEDYYGMSGEQIAYQAFLYDLNNAKKCNGWNWDSTYAVVIRCGSWIGVLLGTGEIYGNDSDGVYQTGNTLRFYTRGTGTHIYADSGVFNASYGLASWDKFTMTIGTHNVIYSSHDIYDSTGSVLLFRATPLESGKDDESDSDFTYDHNYSPKNDVIDDDYEFGSTLENIQTETLVTADEEPNVFLRVFKNISIMVSNSGKYIQALYEEIVHALDYFFNEIIPEVIYMTMHSISEKVSDILDFFNGFYENIKEALVSVFSTVWNYEVADGVSLHSIWQFFYDIVTEIRDLLQSFIDGDISFGDLAISVLPDELQSLIDDIYHSGLNAEGNFSVVSMLEFWFVPHESIVEKEYERLISSIPFVGDIIDIAQSVKNRLVSTVTVAPSFVIPAGTFGFVTIEEPYHVGFEWYEQWRPFTEPIIAGFIYVRLAMHLFHNIPGILNGTSATMSTIGTLNSRDKKGGS